VAVLGACNTNLWNEVHRAETATKMITISDNTATNMLARLGGAASAVPELGLTAAEIAILCRFVRHQYHNSQFKAIDGFGESGDLMSLSCAIACWIMRQTMTNTLLPRSWDKVLPIRQVILARWGCGFS